MKQFINIIILALTIFFSMPSNLFAATTTPKQAESAVKGWLNLDSKPLGTPLGKQIKNVDTFKDGAGAAIYYIVNLQPTGFVVVSADDDVEPIIAFVPSGSYDSSPANPLNALVNQDLQGRIVAARVRQQTINVANRIATRSSAQKKWVTLIEQVKPGVDSRGLPSVPAWVTPLVQSEWSQSLDENSVAACYNYYTPSQFWPTWYAGAPFNYVCGCVATAMAQVMRYHQYPTTGVGTTIFSIAVNGNPSTARLLGGNLSGGPYDWANMPLTTSAYTSTVQRCAIGALCYDAGVAVNMSYTANKSSAWVVNKDENDSTDALVNTFHLCCFRRNHNFLQFD